ncbi:hypothetical protein V5049_11095 [Moellerella wisconsensis]|uniref:hypothetical protein n=1 Tax=Moellerella wisconsensis TaxID=158849 RepID=UPI0030766A03
MGDSLMFTDIDAAIEEARYLKQQFKFDYAVVQKSGREMKIETNHRAEKHHSLAIMFSTKSDRHHTVFPEVR